MKNARVNDVTRVRARRINHRVHLSRSTFYSTTYWCRWWTRDRKMHSEDSGPAFESANANMTWYRDGKIHREEAPARIRKDYAEWWNNGRLLKRVSLDGSE